MADYNEMVKALRDGADFLENSEQEVPKNSFATMCRNAADAIAELADTNVGKWISVKERMPENGENVLMYYERNAWDKNGDRFRKRTMDIGFQYNGNWHVDCCSGVVGLAWMPLPPQPDEETDGQTTL